MLAGRTDPAAGDAAEKLLFVHADADRNEGISSLSNRGEVTIKPFCLPQGSRITIQNIAPVYVGLGESRPHHVVHHVIGNELSLIHQTFGCFAKIGSARDVVAKNVAGGDLGDAEVSHEALSLGSLSYAWSSQK